jgi:hypothetical protein
VDAVDVDASGVTVEWEVGLLPGAALVVPEAVAIVDALLDVIPSGVLVVAA